MLAAQRLHTGGDFMGDGDFGASGCHGEKAASVTNFPA